MKQVETRQVWKTRVAVYQASGQSASEWWLRSSPNPVHIKNDRDIQGSTALNLVNVSR